MDAQTELERALTLIDDLVSGCSYIVDDLEKGVDTDVNDIAFCKIIKNKAEEFLRKHKRIP